MKILVKQIIKKMIGFLFLLCWLNYSFGQDDRKIDVLFSPGIIYQQNLFLDANLLIGELTIVPRKIPIIGVEGWRIGVESNLRSETNFAIAPKIGYEYSMTFFSFRCSALNYFQNGNSEFRLLPEIGFSMGGWANLNYGYGISFNDGDLINVGKHRVSLSFNLNRKLRKAVWKRY